MELFLSKSASTLFTIFLANLLAPEDFGLIAIIAIVFEVSNVLVNAGFTQALIRSTDVSDRMLSTAFWGSLGISIIVYVVVFLLSGSIASFFGEPILEPMIQVLGIGILVSSCRIVQTAILSRRMAFRPQMIAATVATVVSGFIAVGMAYSGFGVWSLVVQMLAVQILGTSILWFSLRWIPIWTFDRFSFIYLFDFGKFLVVSHVLNVGFKNSYALVIAKFFSPELTGMYYFATKLSNLASRQLTEALLGPSFPALSTLKDDNSQLRHKYRQIIQLTMFVLAPTMLMFMALVAPIFELLFDERWKGAVSYTQILCVVGLLFPVHSLNINVLMVKGRSDLNLKLTMIKKAIQIVLLVLSVPFGVSGIVVGQVVGSVIGLLPNSYYTARLICYSFRAQMLDVMRPVVAASFAGVSAWFIAQVDFDLLSLSLFLSSFAGILIYLAASFLLRAEGARMIWLKIFDMYTKKFGNKVYGD